MDQLQTDLMPSLTPKERLDSLGAVIAEKREEAKTDRKSSGIEEVWLKCEESYLGIDDDNRGEWSKARWSKPTSMQGPVTSETKRRDETRSNAYVRLTSRYVDCAHAKITEILLPTDGKVFTFETTPIPDPVMPPEVAQQIGAPQVAQPPAPPGAVPMVAPGQIPAPAAPGVQADPIDASKVVADASAKKAERRITDWLVEAKYQREARKALHDAARIGVGIIKAPFASQTTSRAVETMDGSVAMIMSMKIAPGVKWIDSWNYFPDGTCGEDVHDGDFEFERDFMSPRALKRLKTLPGYLADQIDKVIKEGPNKANVDSTNPNEKHHAKRYEIWYYYGMLSREDMAAAEAVGINDIPEDKADVSAIVTLVNDTVIRAVINPMDSGRSTYNVMNWQRRSGHWAGVGVGEQVDLPQRMLNAATRAMLNNAGRSAGSQIVIDNGAIIPADGNWTMTPDKIWYKAADSVIQDVRMAFMSVQFPNVTPQMMSIIEYAFRLAEESTNIPLISQGISGQTLPDTYGAAQLQNNNANQLLRALAAQYDDMITVPLIDGMYEWLLLDPDVPNDEKGDFKIRAHGSEMIERAIQIQEIVQMGSMVLNPAFGADPAKWFTELLRAWRFNPTMFEMDESKKAQLGQQQQVVPPQAQAAQVRAEAQLKIAELKATEDQQKTQAELAMERELAQLQNETEKYRIQVDTDRDRVLVESERARDQANAQARYEEMQVKRELAMLEYANQQKVTLEQIKADLATNAAKINLQRELSQSAQAIDLHKHHVPPQVLTPPVEPTGRAERGQAFAQ